MDKYTKGEVLGKGTFGTVVKATHKETGQVVAIKKINFENAGEGINVTALREIKLLKELRSPHLVQLLDCFQHKKRNLQLVFEYCETDLELVIKDSSLIFAAADVKAYMQMILRSLVFCHERWVLHRDVKPNNFLVAPTGELKLADFGLARIFGSPDRNYTNQVFARWYRAPELLFGSTMYTSAVDIWAAGCIFAELLLRRPWFPAETDIDQLSQVFRVLGTPTPEAWPGAADLPQFLQFAPAPPVPLDRVFPKVSEDVLDLLSRMVAFDPARRITAAQALQHRYFACHPPPTPPASLPRPALRHPAPGTVADESGDATAPAAEPPLAAAAAANTAGGSPGLQRRKKRRHSPSDPTTASAPRPDGQPASAAAAFDAAQANGSAAADCVKGAAPATDVSMQCAPSAGTPRGDTRRGSHVRQLQLDSEEGAAKRQKGAGGLAVPRVSDVPGRLSMLSEGGTPVAEGLPGGPAAHSTADGDSSGWAPGERPQMASRDLAYLRNRTAAMGNAFAACTNGTHEPDTKHDR